MNEELINKVKDLLGDIAAVLESHAQYDDEGESAESELLESIADIMPDLENARQ